MRSPLLNQQIEKKTGKRTRVIGWYHSHPHITVFPSHVGSYEVSGINSHSEFGLSSLKIFQRQTHDLDLRTQESQQLMDPRFCGIIISCFNTDTENVFVKLFACALHTLAITISILTFF